MDNDIKTWLFDILQAISDIESFFENKPKQVEKYVSDLKTKRAVERELEIIGEAFNRILKNDPSFQIENIHNVLNLIFSLLNKKHLFSRAFWKSYADSFRANPSFYSELDVTDIKIKHVTNSFDYPLVIGA